ncbi:MULTISPECIES: sulfotransferase family 2 domain-containing protein [unclassified Ruegeria]|uniref:sulfotransferase family 2 domain-containing protein n=1 Tax=unclassified Ruegeria TaxID=2625375 RepID=UPI001AE32ED3|nr:MULTISPECIES: sulfotransferase family 2 domain-containing protein [unclassified Ruegeria]
MILSDRHSFVFVHVPKCAGTSVRAAVLPYHDADERFLKTVERHPELGEIDFRHLPLYLLRDLDPEAFEKLKIYDSYALLRDPFQRFQSAMAQRAKMYLGHEFAQLGEKEIRAEFYRVQEYLLSEPHVIGPEFIHFARQSDFVRIGDERFVFNLFPVERLDLFAQALSTHIGAETLQLGHANKTKVFRHPQLKHVARTSSVLARRMLPGPVHETLRRSARRVLMKPVNRAEQPVFDEPEIRDFIANYYEADVALYKEVQADMAIYSLNQQRM